MSTLKRVSGVTVLAAVGALISATQVYAATGDSVLSKISDRDKAPVNYTLAGKGQAESDFRNGILPSAIGKKALVIEKNVAYKIRYQVPVAVVPTRSEFRNRILSSAKGKTTEETAQFARFHLMEK